VRLAAKGGFSFAAMSLPGAALPKRFEYSNHMTANWKKPLERGAVCGNTKAV
jgi:hypothetical protein